MNTHFHSLLLVACFVFVSLVSSPLYAEPKNTKYQEIDWTELMPEDDLEALMNPPESLFDIEDGSAQDNVESFGKKEGQNDAETRYHSALKSDRVIEAFNKKAVKIPGFVVPLEFNQDNLLTEFFIVPYFGACLHMPPPPPNQIIYAKLEKGFDLESIYDAFWFEGLLVIENHETEVGNSAYRINVDSLYLYEE